MKIRPVGAKLFHGTDGHDEANSRFSNATQNSNIKLSVKKKMQMFW
jgi:hypothetical protein